MRYDLRKRETDGVPCIFLNLEGIRIDGVDKNDELLYFPIDKYTNIVQNEDELRAVNELFYHFKNKDDLEVIAITLLVIHNRIRDAFLESNKNGAESMHDITQGIGTLLLDMNRQLNLREKLLEHTKKHVLIVCDSDVGKRDEHTEDLTYCADDMINLHTIMYFCKILTPMFGTIIHYLIRSPIRLGEKVREIHCFSCIAPTIDDSYVVPKDKLVRYIRRTISNGFISDSSTIHYGYTRLYTETIMLASFLIRNIVNHNIYRENSNIITALLSCIRSTIDTLKKKVGDHKVVERTSTNKATGEKHQSQLETNSIIGKKTADMAIIANAFAKNIVKESLQSNGLLLQEHKQLAIAIRKNGVQMTPLNTLLVEMVFASRFSGLTNIRYLDLTTMSELLAVVQLLALHSQMFELTHAISSRNTGYVKSSRTPEDKAILLGYTKCAEFKRYLTTLDGIQIGMKTMVKLFTSVIENIIVDITTYEYSFNTADMILDACGDGVENGKIIAFTPKLSTELYNFLFEHQYVE